MSSNKRVRLVSEDGVRVEAYVGDVLIPNIISIEFAKMLPMKGIEVKLTIIAPEIDLIAEATLNTTKWVLVNTDNFVGDYPDERFYEEYDIVVNTMKIKTFDTVDAAREFAVKINDVLLTGSRRYWKVEREGYNLQGGFVP